MSRLEELIYTLCPNGAEYKPLGSVVKILTAPQKLNRSQYRDIGQYAIVDQGQTLVIGFTDNAKAILPKNKYVVFGDHTRIVKYIDFPFAQGADGLKILLPKDNLLDSKYLYYAFTNLQVPSRGYNRHWSIAQDFLIPIPPMPVQEEIVRILDAFSGVVAELEQKLDAEQAARVRQYEYYRDGLLNFNESDITAASSPKIRELIETLCPDGVEYKRMWELTTWDKKFNGISRYKQPSVIKYHYFLANELKNLATEEGNVKLLFTSTSEQGVTTEDKVGKYLCEGEIVAIPWGGNPQVQYYKGKFVTSDNRIATSNDTCRLSNKFLYYWMISKLPIIASFYRGSGIKHPSMAKVLDLKIPVPPLPVQEEIVRILDTFTNVVEVLETELQAELDARVRQYEYYRDKLLTFPQKPPL